MSADAGAAADRLNPLLYQVNTRVLLHELGLDLGRAVTLDDVPDAFLDDIATRGFDWVWMLGVWQTGPAGRAVSATEPGWLAGYREVLPDFTPEDVVGSPFAVVDYAVHTDLGGDAALARLRTRLAGRGLRLLLDFVPNHTAPDHPWLEDAPHRYVVGSEADLTAQPQNWFRVGERVVAHGRDPYFDGWPDTAQLNYRHPDLRAAMTAELEGVADRCDGVRCDMAMLLEPEVFAATWGDRSLPPDGATPVDTAFWPGAIAAVRRRHPGFLLMAEVYWDMEWQLQQHGFDLTYDKRLYDRLRSGEASAVRGHLMADPDFQHRSARFLENHDEPRAAAILPDLLQHEAAAVVTFLGTGLRFLHEGQLEGRRVKAPLHLRRRPVEEPDPAVRDLYERLLAVLADPVLRTGHWQLLDTAPAWPGNPTSDAYVVTGWSTAPGLPLRWLVAVNLSAEQAQTRVVLRGLLPDAGTLRLTDRLHPGTVYDRDGADLAADGLFLDLPASGCNVFAVSPVEEPT
ncbi:alpha-amylase family glycosyl hydrolase [Auraticoccus monumenti]|uniref:Alpha amylase, catalytic domain n=1 Tax=Auraticoccus monumenti TaxID=675864 RepID=A0A1G6VIV7_9ACTN|nr:alpha-amylase family glycosyl hydrolase [Auraticoccus monumenti]SDD53489.1 Alpha amylase, catalytic domain [Auraticoccus monumenti]